MSLNDADGMANSVAPDQTAPVGAVWSGSALFAQTCLSENLGTLRYLINLGQNLCQTFIHDLCIVSKELHRRNKYQTDFR